MQHLLHALPGIPAAGLSACTVAQAVARSVDELPEAAKRARLMELHIQASARPNCASVLYYPGEYLHWCARTLLLPIVAGQGFAV